MSGNVIEALDQLYLLNKEVCEIISCIDNPVVVVGGQAISYWLSRYTDLISPVNKEMLSAGQSVDIDYIAKLSDIKKISEKWGTVLKIATNHPPPQIALSILKDKNDKIKQNAFDGKLFVNMDDYRYDGTLKGNLVDFIDAPKGFQLSDFSMPKKLTLNTIEFDMSLAFPDIAGNDKLRILTPVACLKSRMSNLIGKIKEPELELSRIKLIRSLITVFFIEKKHREEERDVKLHLDFLVSIVMSSDAAKLYSNYGIDLRLMLDFIVKELNLFDGKYLAYEYPSTIKKIDRKYNISKCKIA